MERIWLCASGGAWRVLVLLVFLGALALAGCGGSGGSGGGQDNSEEPIDAGDDDANNTVTEGFLLEGADSSLGLNATFNSLPEPVAPEFIDDRLITTRLAAVINPSATVAEINDALNTNNAKIIAMLAGQPFVMLAINSVESREQAQTLADALVDSGTFIYARPATTQAGVKAEIGSAKPGHSGNKQSHQPNFHAPSGVGESEAVADQLTSSRLPALWKLAREANDDANFLLAGAITDMVSHPALPAYSIYGLPQAASELDSLSGLVATSAYFDLGIAAGGPVSSGGIATHVGFNTEADAFLNTLMVDTTNYDPFQVVFNLVLGWPPIMGNLVMFMPDTFEDPDGIFFSYVDRAWSAFFWRRLYRTITAGANILYVQPTGYKSAGTDSALLSAEFNSVMGMATVADLDRVAQLSQGTDDADKVEPFLDFFAQTITEDPLNAEGLSNVIFVGASTAAGDQADFSVAGEHVRMLGEGVSGPCVLEDFCSDSLEARDSVTAAAAQVAGLASMLWQLDDLLSPDELLLIIQHAYSAGSATGIVDAYVAALALDAGINSAPMRLAMLDVSGTDDEPDGQFDADDVEAFLAAFEAFEGSVSDDWSVYDLNGDGRTNGGSVRMDLDVNSLPSFTTVTQFVEGEEIDFNESAVSDLEVLCYYVYSPLYSGDTSAAPIIPGCQAASNADASVTASDQLSTAIATAHVSYADSESLEDRYEDIYQSSYSVTASVTNSHAFTDEEPFSGDSSGSASGTHTVAVFDDPEEDLMLRVTLDGSSNTSASSGGTNTNYDSSAFGATGLALEFDVTGTVYYTLSGAVNMGGSGDVDGGSGSGSASIFVTEGKTEWVSISQSSLDDPTLVLDQTGPLGEGSYRLSINVGSRAATDDFHEPGGTYIGSMSASVVFELHRAPQ